MPNAQLSDLDAFSAVAGRRSFRAAAFGGAAESTGTGNPGVI